MKGPTSTIILMLTLTGILACSTADPGPEATQPTPEAGHHEPTTTVTEPDMPVKRQTEPSIEDVISAARKDLAEKWSVTDEQIEVISARRVTWGDGSIGCPEPGMMYTQALVPGYYVHLHAGGQDAYFHAGRNGLPIHCPAERSRPPVDPGDLD